MLALPLRKIDSYAVLPYNAIGALSELFRNIVSLIDHEVLIEDLEGPSAL